MLHILMITLIAFTTVCGSMLLGVSETGGLFGAIIAVGYYSVSVKCGA